MVGNIAAASGCLFIDRGDEDESNSYKKKPLASKLNEIEQVLDKKGMV